MGPLLAIKIGGSLFSDRSSAGHLDEKAIAQYARQLAGLARRHPGRVVLVTGGGSPAHGAIRAADPADPIGLVDLTEALTRVRSAWTAALRAEGVPAMTLQLAAMLGPGPVLAAGALRSLLAAGAFPVLSGDCVLDPDGTQRVLSSDLVPELLVRAVPGRWTVAVLTDQPGLALRPGGEEVLAEVDAADPAGAEGLLWDSGPYDATGGMRSKLDGLVAAAARGAECLLLRGDPERPDLDFLLDGPWPAGLPRTRIARRPAAAAPVSDTEFLDGLVAAARETAVVDLGVLRMRLSSTEPGFAGFSYFSRLLPADAPADWDVVCVDTDRVPVDTDRLDRLTDRTLRGKRFRIGYYLVHYFGHPAWLVTRGRQVLVVGRELERTVWPYVVKHLLTAYAVDEGYLHLKAGGFVRPDGGAVLCFGRNGGGKTFFNTQAVLAGGTYLTNTHVLVRDGVAHGVPSAMRVRVDACFGPLIAAGRFRPHLEGDWIATPHELFEGRTRDVAPVDTLVVVDYRPGPPEVREVSVPAMRAFLEQWGSAMTMYGLKDDVYAYLGEDLGRFAAAAGEMAERLDVLVRSSRRLLVRADMLDPVVRESVLDRLRPG